MGLAKPGADGRSCLRLASIYSRWEVEEDWCLSVLRSYQAEHGPDFPWSVGKAVLGQERGWGEPRKGMDAQMHGPCLSTSLCRGGHECTWKAAAGFVSGELRGGKQEGGA